MTPNVTMGFAGPAIQSKPSDAGKNADAADQGFRDAIDNRGSKRAKAADTPPAEAEARPAGALERLMAKFGIKEETDEVQPDDQDVSGQESEEAVATAVDAPVKEATVVAVPIGNVGMPSEGEPAANGNPAIPAEEKMPDEQPRALAGRENPGPTHMTAEGKQAAASAAAATSAAAQGPVVAPQSKQASDSNTRSNRVNQQQPSNAPGPLVSSDADVPVERPAQTTVASSGNGARWLRDDGRSGEGNSRAAPTPNDAVQSRVNVLGFTAAVAPAATTNAPLGTTAAGVFAAMESEPTWRSAAMDPAAMTGSRGTLNATGVNTLRIQLNPAELGTVTARLTAAGEQLSVEIEVESADARQRLNSDSESILKSLRAIGYDIDKVVITQSSQNASGNPQQGATGREQFASNQQTQDEGAAAGRDGRGAGRQDGEAARHASGENTADHTGGSLYI